MAKKNLSVTPIGIAVWPHLHAPDTKFDANGVFTTKLKLEGAEAENLKAAIDAAIDASVKDRQAKDPKKKIKRADAPYKAETDDDGNETGATLFQFKMNHKGKRKDGTEFTQKPFIFDAKKAEIVGKRIGGGSKIRVSYELSPFMNYTPTIGQGVSLRLKAVQVIELREFSGDAASFGFDEVEGGYEGEGSAATDAAEDFTPAAESKGTQDASDF